jgi:hypothetical protein
MESLTAAAQQNRLPAHDIERIMAARIALANCSYFYYCKNFRLADRKVSLSGKRIFRNRRLCALQAFSRQNMQGCFEIRESEIPVSGLDRQDDNFFERLLHPAKTGGRRFQEKPYVPAKTYGLRATDPAHAAACNTPRRCGDALMFCPNDIFPPVELRK